MSHKQINNLKMSLGPWKLGSLILTFHFRVHALFIPTSWVLNPNKTPLKDDSLDRHIHLSQEGGGSWENLRNRLDVISQVFIDGLVKKFSFTRPISFSYPLHIFGLSFHSSSRQPQLDPAIFLVWCTIIRPSLHSLLCFSLPSATLRLTDSFSPPCSPFLSHVRFFSLSLLFLLSTLCVLLFVSEPLFLPAIALLNPLSFLSPSLSVYK